MVVMKGGSDPSLSPYCLEPWELTENRGRQPNCFGVGRVQTGKRHQLAYKHGKREKNHWGQPYTHVGAICVVVVAAVSACSLSLLLPADNLGPSFRKPFSVKRGLFRSLSLAAANNCILVLPLCERGWSQAPTLRGAGEMRSKVEQKTPLLLVLSREKEGS